MLWLVQCGGLRPLLKRRVANCPVGIHPFALALLATAPALRRLALRAFALRDRKGLLCRRRLVLPGVGAVLRGLLLRILRPLCGAALVGLL